MVEAIRGLEKNQPNNRRFSVIHMLYCCVELLINFFCSLTVKCKNIDSEIIV